MFEQAADRKIKFRLITLSDQQPVSPSIEKTQRAFVSYIQSLMLILDHSPTGRALLHTAMLHRVSVGIDPLLEPSSSFFYPAQNHFDFGYQPEILQKTEKGQGRYLVCFIGGLRRAWHHLHGHDADISLKPGDFLTQFRCEEADIEAIIQLIGWELRAAGHTFLWRHLLSGQNSDMAMVFERVVTEDPNTQFDGRALKAAFNQWFAERERTNVCDRRGLDIIDIALLQQSLHHQMASRFLKRDQMQLIGALPDGGNYLSGCHFTSGWYDGLDDEFNRLHLKSIEQDMMQLFEKQEEFRR